MTPGAVFPIVNLVAFLMWLALSAGPRHPLVLRSAGQVVPLLFALVYTVIVVMRFGRVDGDFSSLGGVAALFRGPWILLAGWVKQSIGSESQCQIAFLPMRPHFLATAIPAASFGCTA